MEVPITHSNTTDLPPLTTLPVKENIHPVMTGWVCPKCGAVMSPWQSTCVNCTRFVQPVIT